jgi:hypothetical protein
MPRVRASIAAQQNTSAKIEEISQTFGGKKNFTPKAGKGTLSKRTQ